MNQREYGAFFLRVIGVVALIWAIQQLALLLSAVAFGNFWVLLVTGVPTAVLLAGGVVLIKSADGVAAAIFPAREMSSGGAAMSADQWFAIALACIGVYLLIVSGADLIRALANALMLHVSARTSPVVIPRGQSLSLVAPLLKIAAGIYLIFGSHTLARWWYGLRMQRPQHLDRVAEDQHR